MLAFGLGTFPSMLFMAAWGVGFRHYFAKPMVRKTGGILLVLLGLWALNMPLQHFLSDTTHHSIEGHGGAQDSMDHSMH